MNSRKSLGCSTGLHSTQYVDFLFLGKCHSFYSFVLLVSSTVASSSSTHILVATGGSNEAIAGGWASIYIFGMGENDFPSKFVVISNFDYSDVSL